ncbi:hypothetical protein MF672_012970 [Actinomadura sp. ATCC 31491]|uniref:Uncharacterized protein n=1 Tax=Actinomadura luzonensis TaxID=2805427 RepID=A0ABT0FQW8_9ACTN|nr:hypothetical protein [Actinomadura luzonensis]MCK2214699.1 hypothetical protein [Actinomadura luzonensis]
MDSESLAAAGLLAALSRTAEIFAGLRHPFVRHEHISTFFPPAGVRVGLAFILPDGREVRFEVSLAAVGDAFQVEGSITAESETILALPRRALPDVRDALAVLDDYADEVAEAANRTIDQLLEEIV